jgi:aminoglycoside 6'-N-acetyltransferase
MSQVATPPARRGASRRPGRDAGGVADTEEEAAEEAELTLRPLADEDLGLLAAWLGAAHVQPWWQEPFDDESVRARYGPTIDGTNTTEVFVIVVDERPVGIIQRYRLSDDPGWERAVGVPGGAGIDYLLGETAALGRGIGSGAIRAMTAAIFEDWPDVDSVTAAPQQANMASWRALEKAGFTRHWEGQLDSDDPADAGPAYVYVARRRHRLM